MPVIGTAFNDAFRSSVGSNTVLVNVPAGVKKGDVLVWWSTSDWTSANGTNVPAGYTVVPPYRMTSFADRQEVSIGVKVAGANEPAQVGASGNAAICGLIALRGVRLAGLHPSYRMTTQAAGTARPSPWPYIAPAYQLTEPSEILWLAFGDSTTQVTGSIVGTVPSGYTKAYEYKVASWFHILVGHRGYAPAGVVAPAIGSGADAGKSAGAVVFSLAFPRLNAPRANTNLLPTTLSAALRAPDALRVTALTAGASLKVRMG